MKKLYKWAVIFTLCLSLWVGIIGLVMSAIEIETEWRAERHCEQRYYCEGGP